MPQYYVDEDYPAGPVIIEPLPERSNWRGSELSTLEYDVYVSRYAVIVVHARNEWVNEWGQYAISPGNRAYCYAELVTSFLTVANNHR